MPPWLIEKLLLHMPAKEISYITGVESPTGACTEGWFVGCMQTSNQLLNDRPERATKKIIEACKLAQDLGADIVGLGALTAVVGDKGFTIAENIDIGVTTGNSYTIATAVEGLVDAARLVGHDTNTATVAVLGATGSIGQVCARLLANSVAKIILVGRRQDALEKVAADIGGPCALEVSTNISEALSKAPLVVAVTSAVDAVVQPEDLLPGAVVCDVARPRDVSKRVAEKREDVLVIEGGVVAIPGDVNFNFDFGFPAKTAYACMAETMILALEEKIGDYSLGNDLGIDRVREIQGLGNKHGFKLAGYRSFERAVDDAVIARVKALAGAEIAAYKKG